MRKASEIVTALFRDRFSPEFVENARIASGLFSSWTEIVAEVWPPGAEQGKDDIPAAAVHSQIRELERGLLQIEADHPGWIQILQTKQGELLSVVQRRYPEMDVRGISFRLSRNLPPNTEKTAHNERAHNEDSGIDKNRELPPRSARPGADSGGQIKTAPPRDEEFYTALKGLEKSIKERNKL